ncbi:PREDICTED: keratin-associated protein 13-1-like [Elephantulus edwardii]|uniref:keratin-associated protein 13-1-like n=1 Tax=Elephantulus edwardii TaxID=28737 RepID=UPI0003F06B1B|nr:PREDICTED: keratin-associated protein 13-1-like [Elephantulus edwardii]
MSYHCSSGNFSSSQSACLHGPVSSCGSSSPSNLVYSMGFCSPMTCQLGSSLYRGCQETTCEPSSCHTSSVVSSPCRTSYYYPRTSALCTPHQATYTRSLGFGSRSCHSLGYGSQSCYSLDCVSNSFKPLSSRGCGFPSVSYGSRLCCPNYFPFTSFQTPCYQPMYRYGFY